MWKDDTRRLEYSSISLESSNNARDAKGGNDIQTFLSITTVRTAEFSLDIAEKASVVPY